MPKAVILSCQGPELLPEERAFFKDVQPLGFILFERHCKSREQVKKLIEDLRSTVSHSFVPILIDQEGGRVVRLKPPIWRSAYPASVFGQLAEKDLALAGQCAFWQASLIGQELAEIGINVNCAPCADLFMPDADPIIGDRAFSDQVPIIHHLSLQTIKGLQSQGIIPIIKHLPGHGRAPVDSHKELPIVETPLDVLHKTDFLAFSQICQSLNDRTPQPWGMTAHVVYNAVDTQLPATHSGVVTQKIIREFIGFEGFLISDCLTMEALEGSFTNRTEKALKAGCDAVLYCKSNLDEMVEVAKAAKTLSSQALQRLEKSLLPKVQTLSPSDQQDYVLSLSKAVKSF
ncbi:beta-N-acetylhexosaminidase [Candidatus Finniella inopinata]|uniref:beta-N-acetylhexosaminidase n=1 Tax=Candidatus Finniella inopinata TaxID=1696036 RepID=A0A4Q7DJR6_9PROT|nr:beta-N-acetylhexosaminidase [Candidatus Finniella inopinata]RZI46600.1 beta-N-acetylhexosaminidase [Candidatus Finniella inopinata]